jgi:teichuronic acid biosynthesis glycosyltransferase TuaG
MPTYNDAVRVMEGIASVRAQSASDWELWLIEDGSRQGVQDAIATQIAALHDSRVHYVPSRHNRGAARARNIGIRLAQGRYIAFLDADDLWQPDKLALQIDAMQRAGAAFSCTGYRNLHETSGKTSLRIPPATTGYQILLRHNTVGCSTVVLDTDRIGKTYFPDLRMRQDFAHWLALTRQGVPVLGLPAPLTTRRMYQGSLSANKWRAARYTWAVYTKVEKLPLGAAVWCYCHYLFGGLVRMLPGHISPPIDRT